MSKGKSRSSRRRSDSRKNLKHAQAQQQQQTQQQSSNSETTSQSTDEVPLNEPRGNLEIMALRLQTKDASLRFLSLDLHTVDHDIIFPFAKALDSSDLLSSLQLRLSHMNRTNANALAWGLKRCKGLQQVKLDYKNLSEKSSIVLAGLLDNPFLESLNLDENEMTADSLKFLSRMINQSKECKLKRLSLQNNPLGDEGAGILAKLITSSRHLRFLNLGGNGIQAAGVSLIRAAINKKNSYLFEVSGLEMVNFNRKRAIGESTEDSTEDQGANKKLRAVPSTSGNPAASQVVSSSQPSSSFGSIRNQSSSNTSSSNETEMAPNSTGSDNGINNAGSDDAPTSSMNDSDDSPSTQSN